LSDVFMNDLYKTLYLTLLQSAKIDTFSKETSVSIKECFFSAPMQENSNDCGVFLCMYAAYHSGKFENKVGCTEAKKIDQTFITSRNCRASICASIMGGQYFSPLYSEAISYVDLDNPKSDEFEKYKEAGSTSEVLEYGKKLDSSNHSTSNILSLNITTAENQNNDVTGSQIYNKDDSSNGNVSDHDQEKDTNQSVILTDLTPPAKVDIQIYHACDDLNDGSNDNPSAKDLGEDFN